MTLMSWVPWTLLIALLPTNATELLQDDAQRQHFHEELMRVTKVYSKMLLFWAYRATQIFAAISFLFIMASLFYAVLYFLVIPSRFHEQDIFFHYGVHHKDMNKYMTFMPTVPKASLNLLDPNHQWQSLISTHKKTTQPVLVPGVKYDVIVELIVPESRTNVDVGMFMVSTTLFNDQEKELATSARPVTLHDMPLPVRWLKLAFWVVPYTLGFSEPAQTLRVTMINGYEESVEFPLTRVDIELNTPELQVYSAKLTVIAQLTGLRYLMYHWAVPTALLFILNIVFLESLALVILYAVYAIPQLSEEAIVDSAVLEVTAADAREKAKNLFETELPTETDVMTAEKIETLIGDRSFSSADVGEPLMTTENTTENSDNTHEDKVEVMEPAVNSM
ncbi:putative Seipin family protein [Plasmopara halstedii]